MFVYCVSCQRTGMFAPCMDGDVPLDCGCLMVLVCAFNQGMTLTFSLSAAAGVSDAAVTALLTTTFGPSTLASALSTPGTVEVTRTPGTVESHRFTHAIHSTPGGGQLAGFGKALRARMARGRRRRSHCSCVRLRKASSCSVEHFTRHGRVVRVHRWRSFSCPVVEPVSRLSMPCPLLTDSHDCIDADVRLTHWLLSWCGCAHPPCSVRQPAVRAG